MIYVDQRTGSASLMGHLRHWHVPCELADLEYGDASFVGNGKDGPIHVGVEIKAVHDALNCMQDGRFAGHQLPGLVNGYDKVWLVVEGHYYPRFADGILLFGKSRKESAMGGRRFMYSALDKWLFTMEVCAGIKIRRTIDRIETARFISNLHSWFQEDYADHHSHLALHDDRSDYAQFAKPSVKRLIAAQLPGVGFKKSLAVDKYFCTIEDMFEATPGDWSQVEGIGRTMAQRIHDVLHSR